MMRKNLMFLALIFGINVAGERVKRSLIFNKGSTLFFSVDVRDNLFDYSKFFAQVFGFKISWTLPYKTGENISLDRIQRRDLHSGLEYFFKQWKLNGKSCIQQLMCAAKFNGPETNHFFTGLFEILFGSAGETLKNIGNFTKASKGIFKECPYSFSNYNVTV